MSELRDVIEAYVSNQRPPGGDSPREIVLAALDRYEAGRLGAVGQGAASRIQGSEGPLREAAQSVVDAYEVQVRGVPLEAPYLGDAIRALRAILERA